jgi:hypothetical protein
MKLKNLFLFAVVGIFVFANPVIALAEDLPAEPEVNFIIRDEGAVLWQGAVTLPEAGEVEINDSNSTPHTINARSVLALLHTADEANDSFSISNLVFFDSFNSFYVKCITGSSGEKCDNWQYAVGDTTPGDSIDARVLSGGETVGLYYGLPHRLTLDKTSMFSGESLGVTAEKYNYADNSWSALPGATVGVTLPNPDDAFNPIVVSTTSVDGSGHASIVISSPNTYQLGIAQDFYFPTYEVVVQAAPASSGGGGSSNSGSSSKKTESTVKNFSLRAARNYLKENQNSDGSFGEGDMYTDWAAVAYGAIGESDSSVELLRKYYQLHNFASQLLTDNERHSTALLALGENPYTFLRKNYIKPIIDSFDGVQFGDQNLVNDDIFALIPLESAGYKTDEEIISKDVKFILSKQSSDGSWEGSVDLTAAAIEALKPLNSLPKVSDALTNAKKYITGKQKDNGGWGSVSSTSWAMQAESILGISTSSATGKDGKDYLGNEQASDGAAVTSAESKNNRIWATSYAIPAYLGKPWSEIMHSVSKPAIAMAPIVTPSVVVVAPQEDKKDDKKVTAQATSEESAKAQDSNSETAATPSSENATDSNNLVATPVAAGHSLTLPIILGVVILGLFAFLKFVI